MSWLIKIAGPEEYLSSLGASPEIIQWIVSQPSPQFYVNEFRKNPQLTLQGLSAIPFKEKSPYTSKELQRTKNFIVPKWALVQLRTMRVKPYPGLPEGEDYIYSISMTEFDSKLNMINDWARLSVPPVDIASYSWDQAVAASDEWHAVSAGQGSGKVYEPTNPELIIFNPPEWEGWNIQQVVSENDLLVEGNIMNNCIGKYFNAVSSGETFVYSLRDPKNRPHVSIEINRYNEIVQIEGNSNQEPDDEYMPYIREWLSKLQKERPTLMIQGEEDFDFSQLKRVYNQDIDDELKRIVYEPNNYGLKPPLDELDIEDVYDSVMNELTGSTYHRGQDTRYVGHIGPVIAQLAWDADVRRAEIYGVFNNPKAQNDENEDYLTFKRESSNKGVDWLWSKIENNNMEFMPGDYFESYLKPEDFETEEEYETAKEEEYYEYEAYERNENLPYALDDAIADKLVKLAREKPFLKEHDQFKVPETQQVAASNVQSWLSRLAQKPMAIPYDMPTPTEMGLSHGIGGIENIDEHMSSETAQKEKQEHPDIKYRGSGYAGLVSQVAPGVLRKYTTDQDEVEVARAAFQDKYPFMVEVLKAPEQIQKDGTTMWAITIKEVRLPTLEEKFLIGYLNIGPYDEQEDLDYNELPSIPRMLQEFGIYHPEMSMPEMMKIYNAYKKFAKQMIEHGFSLRDAHEGNLGWTDDGRLVLFDMGMSMPRAHSVMEGVA